MQAGEARNGGGPEDKVVQCILSLVCKIRPVWLGDRAAPSRAGDIGDSELGQSSVGYTENFDH